MVQTSADCHAVLGSHRHAAGHHDQAHRGAQHKNLHHRDDRPLHVGAGVDGQVSSQDRKEISNVNFKWRTVNGESQAQFRYNSRDSRNFTTKFDICFSLGVLVLECKIENSTAKKCQTETVEIRLSYCLMKTRKTRSI